MQQKLLKPPLLQYPDLTPYVVLQMSPCNSQEIHWSRVYSCRLWWPCSPQTGVTMSAPVGPFWARSRGAFVFDIWCRTMRTYALALAGHTQWDSLSALTCVWSRPPLASMYWGIVLSVCGLPRAHTGQEQDVFPHFRITGFYSDTTQKGSISVLKKQLLLLWRLLFLT